MEAIRSRVKEIEGLIDKLSHELHAARAVKGELLKLLEGMNEDVEKETEDEKDN